MDHERATDILLEAATAGVSTSVEQRLLSLRELLGADLEAVERALPLTLPDTVEPLAQTGRHLILAGGKRLRPILVLLSSRMVGGPLDEAIKLACAGELVHLATLLHDDVIDEGTLRRGVAAPRVVWSNSASVLGGDYALTRALDLVGSVRPREPLSEAIETLRLLVEGEMLQLQHRRSPDPSESAYLDVARRKTASLFRWCCRAGIHLRPDPDALRAMTTFGESLGLCFQVVDDILDMEADPAVSGKRLWLDLAGGKATLPVLLAMQRSEEVRALWQELVTLQASGAADEPLAAKLTARIVSATREAGGIDAARLRARELGERASSALAGAPAGPERTALERIAVELVARVR